VDLLAISIKELILKPHTKFELKPSKQTKRRRGESLPCTPGGTGFAKPGQCAYSVARALVQRFWTFQKLQRKSPEYPGLTDKIVLSGDF
jgi:hypothetical protein